MAASRGTAKLFTTLVLAVLLLSPAVPGHAQQRQNLPPARLIVTGEGSVEVQPDYAEITAGVTTRAKTATEATAANSKLMTAINAALTAAGIDQKDIQTSEFSVQPVYMPPQANTEPKLTGFSVSNQIRVNVRQLDKIGDVLDRLIAAGATNIGNVELAHTDLSKALDDARQAAIADARRKAAIYAHAAALTLGGIAWITEERAAAPAMPVFAMRAAAPVSRVPISAGEDTLQVSVTVGFEAEN